MLKPPKIVITNIDEDPAVRKRRTRKKMAEVGALASIIVVNWMMIISKSCFVYGILSGAITTVVTIIQYFVLLKSPFAIRFGSRSARERWRDNVSPLYSLRWTLGRMMKFACVSDKIATLHK